MTVLVLDNPELIARAAIASGFNSVADTPARQPHRTRFHYGFNKHSLDADDMAFLERHAAYLIQNPGTRVRIHGHSDNFGNEDYNQVSVPAAGQCCGSLPGPERCSGVPDSARRMGLGTAPGNTGRSRCQPAGGAGIHDAGNGSGHSGLSLAATGNRGIQPRFSLRRPARHSTVAEKPGPGSTARSEQCPVPGPSAGRRGH